MKIFLGVMTFILALTANARSQSVGMTAASIHDLRPGKIKAIDSEKLLISWKSDQHMGIGDKITILDQHLSKVLAHGLVVKIIDEHKKRQLIVEIEKFIKKNISLASLALSKNHITENKHLFPSIGKRKKTHVKRKRLHNKSTQIKDHLGDYDKESFGISIKHLSLTDRDESTFNHANQLEFDSNVASFGQIDILMSLMYRRDHLKLDSYRYSIGASHKYNINIIDEVSLGVCASLSHGLSKSLGLYTRLTNTYLRKFPVKFTLSLEKEESKTNNDMRTGNISSQKIAVFYQLPVRTYTNKSYVSFEYASRNSIFGNSVSLSLGYRLSVL